MNNLTQECLKKLFHYDQGTGYFIRLKSSRGRYGKIGSIAGTINPITGYVGIKIGDKKYYAHRLAVFYVTGIWPKNEVDHINGIRSDNKWINLREASRLENRQNLRNALSNNKSTGLLGVSDSPNKDGTFRARIMFNGQLMHLGIFKTADEAHQKYLEVKRRIHEFNTL